MSSRTSAHTLVMRLSEFELLLAGVGAEDLPLPRVRKHALSEEVEISQALSTLIRDGLLFSVDDGMLDYASELRKILRVARDGRSTLVAQDMGENSASLVLRLPPQGEDIALLMETDLLRSDALLLRLGYGQNLVSELIRRAPGSELLEISADGSERTLPATVDSLKELLGEAGTQ